MTAERTPKPPAGLSASTRRWRASVLDSYSMTSTQVRLLDEACASLDRADQARRAIEKHGPTYLDRWSCPKARPEAAIEMTARGSFQRIVRQLEIDEDPPAKPSPKGS